MAQPSDSEIYQAVQTELSEARGIILFGSRATGDAGADSDLDLAVLPAAPLSPLAIWNAGEAIARRFGMDVDLIDLLAAPTVLQYQIVTTGRRIFVAGPELDIYECFILSSMTELNERRGLLLADIEREGSVYAR